MEDPVPVITRNHFKEALEHARKSVTEYDLSKFEAFRTKYDPAYASSKNVGSKKFEINWPDVAQPFVPANDDEDLYS